MISIQSIITALGGMPVLLKNETISVQKDNQQLSITHIRNSIRLGESIQVLQATDGKTDREMLFLVSGEIWLPYYFRIPEKLEVIIYNLDAGGSLQTDNFLQACLEDHARVWDMALSREGFDQLGNEQLPLFAGMV
jgi:hypothetical protein